MNSSYKLIFSLKNIKSVDCFNIREVLILIFYPFFKLFLGFICRMLA